MASNPFKAVPGIMGIRRLFAVAKALVAPPGVMEALDDLLDVYSIPPKVLADHLEVSQPTISRWRSGQSAPDARSRAKIIELHQKFRREDIELVKGHLAKRLPAEGRASLEDLDEPALDIAKAIGELWRKRREGLVKRTFQVLQGFAEQALAALSRPRE